MTSNGAHDPKERAVAFGIAGRDDEGSARLDNLRAEFHSSPPRERMQLGVLVEQMCGSGINLSAVQHLQTGKGEEVDPRWKSCAVLVSYLLPEALGAQSSACPWRLLPSGRIEYAYPVAPWSAPIAPDQPPVVLRVQVWRPPQPGFLEGYWAFSTSGNTPRSHDRQPAGWARWSLCDLADPTPPKALEAWMRLLASHIKPGPEAGQGFIADKAALLNKIAEAVRRLGQTLPTQEAVAVEMGLGGTIPQDKASQLRRYIRDYLGKGLKWHEVLAMALR